MPVIKKYVIGNKEASKLVESLKTEYLTMNKRPLAIDEARK